MNDYYRPGGFSILPPVVKNLLIINVLFFLAKAALATKDIDLDPIFGLSWIESETFRPWQFVTYMFMHGDIGHLFFNMFALWMFGYLLENFWGPKRFIIYYFITGIGAALVQLAINWYGFSEIKSVIDVYAANPNPTDFTILVRDHFEGLYNPQVVDQFVSEWSALPENTNYANESLMLLNDLMQFNMSIPMVGASGAVFGILLAFGMMFPNQRIYVYFLFPIKAKYFVLIYGAIEFFAGVYNPGSGIAHFAHLGGMIFGFLLLLYWKNRYKFRKRRD